MYVALAVHEKNPTPIGNHICHRHVRSQPMPPVHLPRHCIRQCIDQHFLHPVVFRKRNPLKCITMSLELQEAPLLVWEILTWHA